MVRERSQRRSWAFPHLGARLAADHAETEGIPDPVDAVTQPSRAIDELMVSEDTIEGVAAVGLPL